MFFREAAPPSGPFVGHLLLLAHYAFLRSGAIILLPQQSSLILLSFSYPTEEVQLFCQLLLSSANRLFIFKKRTWKMLAPQGVRQAFSTLSLPVDTNHLPLWANFNDRTQLSCKCSWYLSGLVVDSTSTLLFSIL